MTTVIGIDPGKNGGIAVVYPAGSTIMNMPDTPAELLSALMTEASDWDDCVCYLEKVGGMPGNGASAMFTFGREYGHIEMALIAAGIPTITVTPQTWQKYFNVGTISITKSSAAEKREHKHKLKVKAQQLFPEHAKHGNITLKTCDALLIATYGYKIENKGFTLPKDT